MAIMKKAITKIGKEQLKRIFKEIANLLLKGGNILVKLAVA
jgi:hypothetical protein